MLVWSDIIQSHLFSVLEKFPNQSESHSLLLIHTKLLFMMIVFPISVLES